MKIILQVYLAIILIGLLPINIRRQVTQSYVLVDNSGGVIIRCIYSKHKHACVVNILTCNHVVSGAADVQVHLFKFDRTGQYAVQEIVTAKIIFADATVDAAIIQVETRGWYEPVHIATHKPLLLDHVYVAGNQRNRFWITEGSIANLNLRSGKIGINAPIYLGSSGGPCLSSTGELLGISQSVATHLSIFDASPIYHMGTMIDIQAVKLKLNRDYYKYFQGSLTW